MNAKSEVYQSRIRGKGGSRFGRMLVLSGMALATVALAFPVAAGADVALQDDDGYGTAWFVDPGEWYEGPAATAAPASEASAGYLTAWFVDPGEWYDATAEAAVPAGEADNGDPDSRISWFRDPREVERCDC